MIGHAFRLGRRYTGRSPPPGPSYESRGPFRGESWRMGGWGGGTLRRRDGIERGAGIPELHLLRWVGRHTAAITTDRLIEAPRSSS